MDQDHTEVLAAEGVDTTESVNVNGESRFYRIPGGLPAVELWFKLAHSLQGAVPILATDMAAIEYLRQCLRKCGSPTDLPELQPLPAREVLGDLRPRVFRKSLPACLIDAQNEPLEACWLGVIKARGACDLPLAMGFGGIGSCPAPEVHARNVAVWARRFGAMPIAFKHSMMEFAVARPPMREDAALELAREQHAYAPDVSSNGLGGIEKHATALLGLPYWAFWWD